MTNAVNIAGLGGALTVTSGVVNFSSTPTVNSSPIGASAATPTALGTVYGKTDTSLTTANLGYQAGNSQTTGDRNVCIGYQANKSGTDSATVTAVGYQAIGGSGNVQRSTAIGFQSLYNHAGTGSNWNTAVGWQSAYSLTTGQDNVAIGGDALRSTTSGSNGVAVGYNALANCTASGNTALGFYAGSTITNGSQDCYIGTSSNASSASVNYEIVLGVNASIGKGGSTGYINPNGGGVYQGNNSAAWSVTSDQRLKKNIVDNTEGLDIISQIRVRNFEYRTEKEVTELPAHTVIKKEGVQLGVIAQELEQVCPDCIKTETTGVMSVNSDNVFWHMVNAIKDLKALNDTLTARITALEAR